MLEFLGLDKKTVDSITIIVGKDKYGNKQNFNELTINKILEAANELEYDYMASKIQTNADFKNYNERSNFINLNGDLSLQ